MIGNRCYDAHFTKQKTEAQTALVIYPMSQSLNEPSQIWNLSLEDLKIMVSLLLLATFYNLSC